MIAAVKPSFMQKNLYRGCRLACGVERLNMREARSDASFASPSLPQVEVAKDAMLGFLFRGLTAERPSGTALFDALTAEARHKHWYLEGQVPDTLDGRFAVLATVTAIATGRLEREGAKGDRLSVALAERFIEVMESEHRELGLGDPVLGRTVRKLVAVLAKRTGLWRAVRAGEQDAIEATRESLYREVAAVMALNHSAAALKRLAARLESVPLADIEHGRLR
jgi:cytochrome b pre-mRNA-processing protein 3